MRYFVEGRVGGGCPKIRKSVCRIAKKTWMAQYSKHNNGLFSKVKKAFIKAHLRIQALPDCLLPPEPFPTKWCS